MPLSVARFRKMNSIPPAQIGRGSKNGTLFFDAAAGNLFCLFGIAGAGASEGVVAAQSVEWG